MTRREELKKLLARLAEISQEMLPSDCPQDKRRALHRETREILTRIDELENERLREKIVAKYPEEDSSDKK